MRLLFHSHPSHIISHLDQPITNHIQDHYQEFLKEFWASTKLIMNTVQVKDRHAYIRSCSRQLQLQEGTQTLSKITSIICNNILSYTHYRIHIFCWWALTHDCLIEERSYMDTWPCMQRASKSSLYFDSLYQHSLLEINSFVKEDSQRIQKFITGPHIVHVCLHK